MNFEQFLRRTHNVEMLNSKQLRQKWQETFGIRPENAYSCDYMRKHLSEYGRYEQEKAERARPKRRKYAPYPGLTRIRRYKGEDHIVREVENGFEYRGELYDSYSAIAGKITGQRVSGLTFFDVGHDSRWEIDVNGLRRRS